MGSPGVHAVKSIRGVYALVVDADPARRAVLTILEYCGAYVRESDTAERALRLIGALRPDVLVAQFPAIDDAFISDLRRLKGGRGGVVPIIAVRASGLATTALAYGFDAFLATPFVPWDL